MIDGIWRSPLPVNLPASFPVSRCEHLLSIEDSHFWFHAREWLIGKLIDRLLRQGDQSILELGCGSGHMLKRLEATGRNISAVEGHPLLLAHAIKRCERVTLMQADAEDLPLAADQFDFLMALDVLEHTDAGRFLSEARRVAHRGARLLASVPSNAALWSSMDVHAGHRCRYDRIMLAEELKKNGWISIGYTHYQFLLYPAIWLSRRNIDRVGEVERQPPVWLSTILNGINMMEVSLLSELSLPWGSSLFMWAEAA